MNWKVIYSNDVGPNDEGFWEWWMITDGSREFKSENEAEAEWLCGVLNKIQGAPEKDQT